MDVAGFGTLEIAGVASIATLIINRLADAAIARWNGKSKVDEALKVAEIGAEEKALKLAVDVLQRSVESCQAQHSTAEKRIQDLWERIRWLEKNLIAHRARVSVLEASLRAAGITVPDEPRVMEDDVGGIPMSVFMSRQANGPR